MTAPNVANSIPKSHGLHCCALVIAGFVIWRYFNEAAVLVAVLTCNLTALIWSVLAMICLFILPHCGAPLRVCESFEPRPSGSVTDKDL